MIYFIEAPEVRRIKIGFSTDWQNRFLSFLVASPTMLDLLVVAEGSIQQEHALHRVFRHLRHSGEWFNAGPELLEFCRCLKETPEDERQAVIANAIARQVDDYRASALTFDCEAEAASLRGCVQAFIAKHGRATTATLAGVTMGAVAFWARGSATIGPVRLLKLAAYDSALFEPFWGFRISFAPEPELRRLRREADALIVKIEEEAA